MDLKFFEPQVGARELTYLEDVLKSGYLNDGWAVRNLETKLATWVGTEYCVGVTSGTAALTLALMSLGVGQGDEVIVPNLTFIGTANAVRLAGAEVKLVDIEPERLTLDPEKLRKSVTSKTKAVIAVDVNGRSCFYEEIEPYLTIQGIHLITDSCGALCSSYRGKSLGSFGDAGCFSFSPNKFITTGQGGAICTNNKEIHKRLLQLKNQGMEFQGTGGDDNHESLGFNFKLTNLQAAVGRAQFEKLWERRDHSKKLNEWYRKYLNRKMLPTGEGCLQWQDVYLEDRERVCVKLDKEKIGYRKYWHPLNTQKAYKDASFYPVSEEMSRKMLWLPSGFDLIEDDVKKVCEVIN